MVERASRDGQRLGNYRLVRLLGRGGFAEVYLAEHIHLNTQAAVKLLNTHLAQEGIDGFRNEARMIAGLIDPHIVRVLDFGVEDSVPYLVMDYAPSGTLRERHPKGSRLPPQLVVRYVQQVASALQYAHDQRLIHRDVKPENMLVGRNQEILLSDFGIALVAQSSQYQQTQNIAGTLAYMAPEQIQAHPRPASDQYSLGIVVYEWLGGQRPFQGTMTEIAIKHATAAPPPLRLLAPDLPPAVEQVVLTALQKDPHSRFPSTLAFAQALEQASSQHSRSFAGNFASMSSNEAPPNQVQPSQPSQTQTPGFSGSMQRPGTIPTQFASGFTPAFSNEVPTNQVQPSQSSQMQPPGFSGSMQHPGTIPTQFAGGFTPAFSNEVPTNQVQPSQFSQMQTPGFSGSEQHPDTITAQPMSQTHGQPLPNAASPFSPPIDSSRARFYARPIVLLILMGVIAVLLFEGLLGFPGLFFWFIGGDLMQLWFLVLVVLGFLYRGALARLWKRGKPMERSQAFSPESSAAQWPALAQERSSGKFVQGLLHVPLVLLVGFLVYYFFIVGYTFPVGPHLTVTGDCNGGTITVQGKTSSDMVSLKAGLMTIEGSGNYDSTNHVLNVSGNLCGFTLEVPATTNLHLSSNDATIWVTGVTGKIELDNNAGDINIDGSTLLAGSVVSNNAGKITISNSCLAPGVNVGSNGSPVTQSQVKPCN